MAAQMDLFESHRRQPGDRRRGLPKMSVIEEHHGVTPGHCYRCGEPARCEKAHVVDRALGGADLVENLVPLCFPCHDDMPSFRLDEERYAKAWLRRDVLTYLEWSFTKVVTRLSRIGKDVDPGQVVDLIVAFKSADWGIEAPPLTEVQRAKLAGLLAPVRRPLPRGTQLARAAA